jgi:hypothetical protein
VYEKYFRSLSQYELNIDGGIKSRLEKSIANPTRDMYDDAQNHVWRMMVLDCVPKFLKSEDYENYRGTKCQSERYVITMLQLVYKLNLEQLPRLALIQDVCYKDT